MTSAMEPCYYRSTVVLHRFLPFPTVPSPVLRRSFAGPITDIDCAYMHSTKRRSFATGHEIDTGVSLAIIPFASSLRGKLWGVMIDQSTVKLGCIEVIDERRCPPLRKT